MITTQAMIDDYWKAFQNAGWNVNRETNTVSGPTTPTSPTSGTSGTNSAFGSFGDISGAYKELAGMQFDQTKNLMGLSNFYREKEGATQRQVMDRSAQITEQQRQNDAMRAQSALRNFRKMGF